MKAVGLLVPPGVVTMTSTVPLPAGEVALISVVLSAVNEPAAVAPNMTPAAFPRLLPWMVTEVPPEDPPLSGVKAVMVGAPGGGRV